MDMEIIQIFWAAFGLFFGIGQAMLILIATCCPSDTDKAISYLAWIVPWANWILRITLVALILAVALIWYYFIDHPSSTGYIISIFISVLGISFHLITYNLIRSIIFTRLLD